MGSSWDDIYGPASFKKIRYDIWPLPRQQSKNVIKSHVDLQQETLLCQNDHDIWFILDAEGSAQRVVLIENCCNISSTSLGHTLVVNCFIAYEQLATQGKLM